jgi:hypothetical protein
MLGLVSIFIFLFFVFGCGLSLNVILIGFFYFTFDRYTPGLSKTIKSDMSHISLQH